MSQTTQMEDGAQPGGSGYVVICADGEIRHAGNFVKRSDAEKYAETGHVCTNGHRIIWRVGVRDYNGGVQPRQGTDS